MWPSPFCRKNSPFPSFSGFMKSCWEKNYIRPISAKDKGSGGGRRNIIQPGFPTGPASITDGRGTERRQGKMSRWKAFLKAETADWKKMGGYLAGSGSRNHCPSFSVLGR